MIHSHHIYVPFVFRIWDVIFMSFVMIMMIASFSLVIYLYVMKGDKNHGKSDKRDE